jgi:cytochrome c-type biogenesis protein
MPDISLYMTFAAGLISFLSPCVLPLVPGYLSYISGISLAEIREKQQAPAFLSRDKGAILLNSTCFVLGFSIVFVSMGASATWLGALLSSRISLLSKIAGLVIIFFGIYKMGLIRARFFYKEARFEVKNRKFGYAGAVIIGAAFAFGWTPCIGPILAGVLTYAGTLEKVNQGIILLLVYSLGLGLPFLLTAAAINHFWRFFGRMKKYLHVLEMASGAVMVALGLLIFTNKLILIPGYFTFLNKFAL